MQTNQKKRIKINILTKQGFQDIIPPFKDGEIQFEKLEKKQKPESANCFKKQSEQQIPLENLNQQSILQDSQLYQRDELKPKTQIDDSNSIFQIEMWTFFEQRFQNIASNYINQAICKICEQQLHDITLSKLIGHSMTCGQEDNQFQKLNTIDQKVQQNEINDNGLKSITLTKTIESIKKLEVQNQIITSNYNEINNQELLNSKTLQRNELLQNIKTTLGPDKLKDFQRIKELVEQKSFFKKPSKHLSKLMKEMGINQRFLQLRQLQYECFLEVRRKQIVSKQKECRDKMKQNHMYFCQEMLAHYAAIEKHFLISKELSSQSAPQTLDPAANAIFQCPDIDF